MVNSSALAATKSVQGRVSPGCNRSTGAGVRASFRNLSRRHRRVLGKRTGERRQRAHDAASVHFDHGRGRLGRRAVATGKCRRRWASVAITLCPLVPVRPSRHARPQCGAAHLPQWLGMYGRESFVFELMLVYLVPGVAVMIIVSLLHKASTRKADRRFFPAPENSRRAGTKADRRRRADHLFRQHASQSAGNKIPPPRTLRRVRCGGGCVCAGSGAAEIARGDWDVRECEAASGRCGVACMLRANQHERSDLRQNRSTDIHDIGVSNLAIFCSSTVPSNPSATSPAARKPSLGAGRGDSPRRDRFCSNFQLWKTAVGSEDHAFTHRRDHRGVSPSSRRRRSLQCTHPLSAIGPRAAEILAGHEKTHPFAVDSPLGKLWKLNAWVLLLGCGHNSSSTIHIAEEEAENVPYLHRTRVQTILDGDRTHQVTVRRPGRSNGFLQD